MRIFKLPSLSLPFFTFFFPREKLMFEKELIKEGEDLRAEEIEESVARSRGRIQSDAVDTSDERSGYCFRSKQKETVRYRMFKGKWVDSASLNF